MLVVKCVKQSQFPLLPEVTIKNESNNVVVRSVPDDGLFSRAGVADGDIIVSVNGTSFENIDSARVFKHLSSLTGDVRIMFKKEKIIPGPLVMESTAAQKEGSATAEDAKASSFPVETLIKAIPPGPPIKRQAVPDTKQSKKRKVAVMEQMIKKVQTAVSKPSQSVEVLQKENQILKQKIEELKKDNDEYSKTQTEFREQLQEVKLLSDKVEREKVTKMAAMGDQLLEKQKIIDQKVLECQNLEAENAKHLNLVEKVLKLEEDLGELDDKNRCQGELISKLEKELSEKSEELLQSESKLLKSESRYKDKEEQVKELETKIETQLEITKKLDKDFRDCYDKKKKLKKEVFTIEKIIKEVKTDKEKVEQRHNDNVKAVTDELNLAKDRINQQYALVKALQEENHELKSKANQENQDVTIKELEDRLEEEKKARLSVEAELEELKSKQEDESADNVLTKQIEQEMTKNLESENKMLKQRLEKLFIKERELKDNLNHCMNKNKTLKERVNRFDSFAEEVTLALRLKRKEKEREPLPEQSPADPRRKQRRISLDGSHNERKPSLSKSFDESRKRKPEDSPRPDHSANKRWKTDSFKPVKKSDKSSLYEPIGNSPIFDDESSTSHLEIRSVGGK